MINGQPCRWFVWAFWTAFAEELLVSPLARCRRGLRQRRTELPELAERTEKLLDGIGSAALEDTRYLLMKRRCEALPIDGDVAAFTPVAVDVRGYVDRAASTLGLAHPVHLLARSLRWEPAGARRVVERFECFSFCVPQSCLEERRASQEAGYLLRDLVVSWVLQMCLQVFDPWAKELTFSYFSQGLPWVEPGAEFGRCGPGGARTPAGANASGSGPNGGGRGGGGGGAGGGEGAAPPLLLPELPPRPRLQPAEQVPSPAARSIRAARAEAALRGHWFLVMLTSPAYLPGVIVVHHSLLRARSRFPFCVAVTSNVPRSYARLLEDAGVWIVHLPDVGPAPGRVGQRNDASWWIHANARMDLFGLGAKGLRKIVNLDADVLVLRNVDDLFARPAGAAFRPGLAEAELHFNIGVHVLEPDVALHHALRTRLEDDLQGGVSGSPTGCDQRILNAQMGGHAAFEARPDLHLEERYNAFAEQLGAVVRRGLQLQGFVRFGRGPGETLLDLWRCIHGGFDHCCEAGGLRPRETSPHFDGSACLEGGLDHRRCCGPAAVLRAQGLVRVAHFILRKPWATTNLSLLYNEGRPLSSPARRAYELWFEAAEAACSQYLRLFRALDDGGVEARELLAAGDGV